MLRFVPEGTQCFVVMDLEWNQHASRPNHAIPHEIIEIGAVKLDRDLRLLDERQYIIKPVGAPQLVPESDPRKPYADAAGDFSDKP